MQEYLVMFAKMIRKLLFCNSYITIEYSLDICDFHELSSLGAHSFLNSLLLCFLFLFLNQTKQNVSLSWVVLEVNALGRAVVGFPCWAFGSIPALALQLTSYASLRLTTLTCGMDFRDLLQEFKFQMLSSWVPRDDCNTPNIVLKNHDVICTVFFGFIR